MAGTDRIPPLRLCSVATFHAVSFVVAIAIIAHLGGSLPKALGQLDTLSGFAFFVLLWAITAFTTRLGLRNIGSAIDEPSAAAILESTIVAAGWNGVGVFAILVVTTIVRALIGGAGGPSVIPVLLFSSVIGGLLAFVVGGIAGFLYGLVDASLIEIGAWLFRWAATDADPSPAVAS